MKRFMKHIFVFAFCLLFAIGCATPNRRLWYNANIEADGDIGRKGKVVYSGIRIGTDEFPYDGRQPFVIRLPSGTVLSSDDFSEPTIRPIALAMLKTGDSVIRHDPKYGRSKYFLEGVKFEYENKRLISIYISWKKQSIPEIAKTSSDKFYAFPVPEKHIEEIFGPPDKTNDFFTW
jgi:hypothetical protein